MKLELRGMSKRFGKVVANDNISLTVNPGEILGLLGENGAGKSTLMNLLYGLYQADSGDILLDDQRVSFRGPGDAMAAGIGMVHQHFMLIPVFTVAENVILGHEPTRAAGVLDLDEARRMVREISERFGFSVDPDAVVEDLPVGVQQRVEIIKALARDAKVLVLDEPTAVLTPQETDELMDIMRQLANEGTSIVFITHKLREVQEVCDRIVVIRQGKVVETASPDTAIDKLASLMVGRAVDLSVDKDPAQPGEVVLSISDLTVIDERNQKVLDAVSLEVRSGEVLAIAGVQGNGQTELAEALLGLREPASGTIVLAGEDITHDSVREVLDKGVGFIPEDRKKDGLVGEFTLAENFMLNAYQQAPWVNGVSIDLDARAQRSDELIEAFDVRTPSSATLAKNLSGGNQQKVVVARELSRDLNLLIAAQPTRGVDVGSIEFIHEQIIATRDRGIPVVIVSTELDEVYALADRIAVMYRGRIVGVVNPDIPREELGQLMAGVTKESVA
ncbi:riboflavin ABC transporter ATP-binding protein [Pontimonas salivibrio]|uniref:Riboflavin ABC transporter ATP-binding protein n=1 Tax=Pontimonas salivibrio TaxID=1159327 RepID=A0A2L2BSE9_9MICO|nr:ABC transporter ATP-binding protein [Pontimonas salivibrio]AVG24603.1 riboflavin ABC transporter ATP-binding protein [Pontimonas salivibrio]